MTPTPNADQIERAQNILADLGFEAAPDDGRTIEVAQALVAEAALVLEKTTELYALALEIEADRLRQSSSIDRRDGFDDVARATDKDAEVWEAAARCIRALATPKATEDQKP